jgi:hypothetical protein
MQIWSDHAGSISGELDDNMYVLSRWSQNTADIRAFAAPNMTILALTWYHRVSMVYVYHIIWYDLPMAISGELDGHLNDISRW